MIKMFLLVMVVALATCGVQSTSKVKRMVNGEPSDIKDYPYLVFIGSEGSICGGAIISRHYVLTAAHCVRESGDQIYVRAGSSFRNRDGSVHQLENVTLHQEFSVDAFDQRSMYDVAVVRVKEAFVYDDTRQPVELPESGYEVKVNASAKGAGWGKNEEAWFFTQFSKMSFRVVDTDTCNETYKSWSGIVEGQFCATSEDPSSKHICHGDSGTPLVVDNKLVGVTIYGGGCELENSPSVYSDVGFFRSWIDDYVTFDDPATEVTPEVEKTTSLTLLPVETISTTLDYDDTFTEPTVANDEETTISN